MPTGVIRTGWEAVLPLGGTEQRGRQTHSSKQGWQVQVLTRLPAAGRALEEARGFPNVWVEGRCGGSGARGPPWRQSGCRQHPPTPRPSPPHRARPLHPDLSLGPLISIPTAVPTFPTLAFKLPLCSDSCSLLDSPTQAFKGISRGTRQLSRPATDVRPAQTPPHGPAGQAAQHHPSVLPPHPPRASGSLTTLHSARSLVRTSSRGRRLPTQLPPHARPSCRLPEQLAHSHALVCLYRGVCTGRPPHLCGLTAQATG